MSRPMKMLAYVISLVNICTILGLIFIPRVDADQAVDGRIEFEMSWDAAQDRLSHFVWRSRGTSWPDGRSSSDNVIKDGLRRRPNSKYNSSGSSSRRQQRHVDQSYEKKSLDRKLPGANIISSPTRKLVSAQVLRGDDIMHISRRQTYFGSLPLAGSGINKHVDMAQFSPSGMTRGRDKRRDVPDGGPGQTPECVHRPTSTESPRTKVKDGRERTEKLSGRHVVVMREEQDDVRLSCHYCNEDEEAGQRQTETEQMSQRRSVLWYRLSRTRHQGIVYELKEVALDLSDDDNINRVHVTDSHTLVIKRSKVKDSGSYFCQEPNNLDMRPRSRLTEHQLAKLIKNPRIRFMYHVDVMKVKDVKVLKVSSRRGADGLPTSAPPVNVLDLNAKVAIHWESWSPCSICDTPGTRKRIGLCHVSKLDGQKAAKPIFLDALLSSYAAGIPCRSTLFHGHELLRHHISKADEVMEEGCHVTCAEYHAQLVLSPRGFLGGYVTGNSKKVKAQERFREQEGDEVTLKCPSSPVDLPAVWVNGSSVLLPTNVANESRGRASIDEKNTLRISPILRFDSASYVCVVGGQVKGFVRLEVIPTPAECKTCRYALYLSLTFPVHFIIYLMIVYARHVQHRKAKALRRSVAD